MAFTSLKFLLFLAGVAAVQVALPGPLRAGWLLVASYVFYAGFGRRYLALLVGMTIISYGLAIMLAKRREKGLGGAGPLLGAVLTLLMPLLAYKYFGFIWGLVRGAGSDPLRLVLPAGISFYTFRAVSYVIDVARGTIAPAQNLVDYALYIGFFPELVSGPIDRAGAFLQQVTSVRNATRRELASGERLERGAILVLWGLFLKMVVADRAAVLVNTVYNSYWQFGSAELVVATLLYSVEILGDFAGYSTIAIGAGKLLGYDLMENFRVPYAATSVQDFWRRWHISLSTWFRDYLYFPLGGSRCSRLRHNINLIITFLVSGIWHGAGWCFVAWGLLHGAYQVVGTASREWKRRLELRWHWRTNTMSYQLGRIVLTFGLVSFAWVFFRAPGLRAALSIVRQMVTRVNPWVLTDGTLATLGLGVGDLVVLAAGIMVMLVADVAQEHTGLSIDGCLMREMTYFRWASVIALVVAVFVFGVYGPAFDAQSFIYFGF